MTKPAKGEVESSSTTPTKVVSTTPNVENQQLLHQKQQKMLFKLQQVLAKQKIVLHYKKQTLKTQMMDTQSQNSKNTQENKAKSLPQTGEESNKDMTLPLMALLALVASLHSYYLENVKTN